MQRKNKIFLILIVTFLLVSIFSEVFADIDPEAYKPDKITTDDAVEAVEKVGIILGVIRNITVVFSVIILMVIGVKYIIGSVEEKANYKATLLPYVIGIIFAVSGVTVVDFIYNAIH